MEPCGTPHRISSIDDLLFSNSTNCFQFVRYFRTQSIATPLIPYLFNLCSNISWFITSKAFEMSHRTAKVNSGFDLLFASTQKLRKVDNGVHCSIVECFDRNQYWCPYKIFLEFKKFIISSNIIISPKFENFGDIMFLVAPPSPPPPPPPPHDNACTGHNFVTNTPIKFLFAIAIEIPDYKNPIIFGINWKNKMASGDHSVYKCSQSLWHL